jgi:single-stranded-DNA-specific exonuclease
LPPGAAGRRWRVPSVDEGQCAALAEALGVRPLTARVLLGRGLGAAPAATRFLAPRLADLRLPEGIADLPKAVERLERAVLAGERIGIYGDYDVDGVTTAAVLALALRGLGAQPVARAAHRFSGYGFSPEQARRFCDEGCTLVLTGDCGTSDLASLALCRERGVDVVVIDHHQVPSGPSEAFALINPHRPDDAFSFKGLASCGVAFYLAAALRTRLRERNHPPAATFDPRGLLDLVALGTIADLVPLIEDNRILVAAGLRELTARRRPGLRVLGQIAELGPESIIDATTVSFRLTPRLNAPGRLGEAQRALDLLLCQDEEEAHRRAMEIDEVNRTRQRIQEEVWTAASAAAAAQLEADAPAVVVGAEGWHPGVVGIVAAKLVERHRRPAVVVAFEGGVGRGSARTINGFHLHAGLTSCAVHLQAFGGHAGAAGMTVTAACFPAFQQAFWEAARTHAGSHAAAVEAVADAAADLSQLDLPQVEELARLAPFGHSNAEPLVALPQVQVQSTRVVGERHLQLTLSGNGAVAEAIAFGMAADAPPEGAQVDILASPEVDAFRGYRRPRLRVKHIFRQET